MNQDLLSPCRVCDHMVSKNSQSCPNCGEPKPYGTGVTIETSISPDGTKDERITLPDGTEERKITLPDGTELTIDEYQKRMFGSGKYEDLPLSVRGCFWIFVIFFFIIILGMVITSL